MPHDDDPPTGAERARYWTVAEGGGTELLSARYVTHAFGLHTHPTYTLAVVTGGAEQFRYRGAQHRIGPGQIALLNPDEPHDGSRAVEAGWRRGARPGSAGPPGPARPDAGRHGSDIARRPR